jgi:sugar phosphate isomerase/epimerase
VAILKLGIDPGKWQVPLKKALRAEAELAVDGVVLDASGEIRPQEFGRTAVRQLRKMLDDLNLRLVAVSFRSRRGHATTEGLDRRVQATKAALDPRAAQRAGLLPGESGVARRGLDC